MRIPVALPFSSGSLVCRRITCLVVALLAVDMVAVECEAQRRGRGARRQMQKQVEQQRKALEEQQKILLEQQQAILKARQQAEQERLQKQQEAAAARRQAREERRERARQRRLEQQGQEGAPARPTTETLAGHDPDDEEDPALPEFEGQVLRIDDVTGAIWIDLGSDDGVTPGELFHVYRKQPRTDAVEGEGGDAVDEASGPAVPPRGAGTETAKRKEALSSAGSGTEGETEAADGLKDSDEEFDFVEIATIQVSRLIGPSLAEARIEKRDDDDAEAEAEDDEIPILRGDQIAPADLDDEPEDQAADERE